MNRSQGIILSSNLKPGVLYSTFLYATLVTLTLPKEGFMVLYPAWTLRRAPALQCRDHGLVLPADPRTARQDTTVAGQTQRAG